MSLPSSGTLRISDIMTALDSGYGSLHYLSGLAGFGTPDYMTDFYGYNPCPAYGTYISEYCSGCALYYVYANGSCGTYDTLISYNYYGCGGGCGGYCCSYGGYYDFCDFYSYPCYYYGLEPCVGC